MIPQNWSDWMDFSYSLDQTDRAVIHCPECTIQRTTFQNSPVMSLLNLFCRSCI